MRVAEALQTAYNQEPDPKKKQIIQAKIIELVKQAQTSGPFSDQTGNGMPEMATPTRPTAAEAVSLANVLSPKPDLSALEKQLSDLQALLKQRPNTSQDRMDALEQMHQDEVSNRPAEDQIRRWTMAAAAARKGDVGGFGEAVIANRERATKENAMYSEGLAALKDREFGLKVGDNKLVEDANYRLADIREKYDSLRERAGSSSLNALTNMYATDQTRLERLLDRKANERIANSGGVQGAAMRMYLENPEQYAAFMQATAGGKKTRSEILAGYADDYNRAMENPMNGLKEQGINTLDQYIVYRDNLLANQSASSGKRIDFNSIK
jgi:hypothetical protein